MLSSLVATFVEPSTAGTTEMMHKHEACDVCGQVERDTEIRITTEAESGRINGSLQIVWLPAVASGSGRHLSLLRL